MGVFQILYIHCQEFISLHQPVKVRGMELSDMANAFNKEGFKTVIIMIIGKPNVNQTGKKFH